MSYQQYRPWLIRWLYGYALVHLLLGVVMTWVMQSSFFDSYHHEVVSKFWPSDAPAAARELHLWWLKLFGATLQFVGILMGVLVYLGSSTRRPAAWLWMMVGLLVWGPQDIYVSLQRHLWMHLWIDVFVLATILPPLLILWRKDSVGAQRDI